MEKGEVEVGVRNCEQRELACGLPVRQRTSLTFQAKIAQLGASLGFRIWLPQNERNRIVKRLPAACHPSVVTALPLNYDAETQKTIEAIDVIWLQGRTIARAFEVEHSTVIFSGLLRMADLLAMQPRTKIPLHVVAPTERRDQVRREIVRPVFSVLEGGAMAKRCSFISYEAIDEMLAQPNLSHMKETVIEDYEEYFDAV